MFLNACSNMETPSSLFGWVDLRQPIRVLAALQTTLRSAPKLDSREQGRERGKHRGSDGRVHGVARRLRRGLNLHGQLGRGFTNGGLNSDCSGLLLRGKVPLCNQKGLDVLLNRREPLNRFTQTFVDFADSIDGRLRILG